MNKKIKIKVEFAPGCFDEFDGTQEELDEVMDYIRGVFEGMDINDIENNEDLLDLEDLAEEDPELYEELISRRNNRKLH